MRINKCIIILVVVLIMSTFLLSNDVIASPTSTEILEKVEKAIEYAMSQYPNNPNKYKYRCLTFVSEAFVKANYPKAKNPKNYKYATLAANDLIKFTDKNPPRGAVVFYDWSGWVDGEYGNWGHVALSLGNGKIIHNLKDKIVVTSLDIGLKYRGWGYWRGHEIPYLPDVVIKNGDQLTAGGFFTVAMKDDGTVWSWGRFTSQRIDGKNPNNAVPTKVLGIENAVSVSAGFSHTAALKKDGTVWSWGDNEFGQLGDGTEIERRFPVQAKGLDRVIKIATGEDYTVALREDGTIWTWGRNEFSQLGDGTINNSNVPTQVNAIKSVVDIYAGGRNTMVRTKDGKVWGWGVHYGDKPAELPEFAEMVAISIGAEHGLAIKPDGTVWSFGWNFFGERGFGKADNIFVDELTQVKGLNRIVAVATGNANSVALKEDGTVWAWGSSYDGKNTITTPVQVSGLEDVVAITTGLYRSHHIAAIKNDGTIWSIGWNDSDQLGIGRIKDERVSNVPVQSFINLNNKVIKSIDPSSIMVYMEEFKVNGKDVLLQSFWGEKVYTRDYYVRLRDLAMVLDGTEKQFDVTWSDEKKVVNIITGKPYTRIGDEAKFNDNINSLNMNISMICKDNVDMQLITLSIDNDHYVNIMDLAQILNFKISENPVTYFLEIDTTRGFNSESI